MTLTLYIARRFLKMFGLVFGVFMAILLLIDVIDQLRKVGVTLGGALYLSLLNVPESLYQILPLIMILTAIALFLGLARSSERVVVRASGRSGLQFLAAPVVMALLIGAVAVAVFNPLVAATSKAYDRLAAQRGQHCHAQRALGHHSGQQRVRLLQPQRGRHPQRAQVLIERGNFGQRRLHLDARRAGAG